MSTNSRALVWVRQILRQVGLTGASTGTSSTAGSPNFDAVTIGGATTSGVRLDVSSGDLRVREGDNSAAGVLQVLQVKLAGSDTRLGRNAAGVVDVLGSAGTSLYTLPGVLTKSVTSAQTGANTDETTLWSYSLPAGTLASDAQAVRVTVFGSTAANGNTKTINLKFGGTTLRQFSAAFNNQTWVMTGEVFRTGATTQLGNVRGQTGATAAAAVLTTPAETLANAVTIALTGQNGTASDGDIVFRGAIVEFLP